MASKLLCSQTLDSTVLRPVILTEMRHDLVYKTDSIASASMLGHTLDQSIALIAPFYIKNYGSGNISTGSYRGGNASQIAVKWNGVTLQNLNSGNVDFSLIPGNVSDQFSFMSTGSNNSFGEVQLSNKVLFQKSLHLQLAHHYATQDILSQQILISKASKRHALRVGLSQRKGNNEYPYPDGDDIGKQKHAQLYQKNATIDYSFSLNRKTKLSLGYWGQNFDRQVPTALHMVSHASQKDQFHRLMVGFEKTGLRSQISYRQAFLKEEMRYLDRTKDLNSHIGSINWLNVLQVDREIRPHFKAQLQIQNSAQSSSSGNYDHKILRNIFHISPSLTNTIKVTQSKIRTFAKAEWVNDRINPFQYGISLDQSILKKLSLHAQVQRYLRNPTFNDLYWKDWGNPILQPEYGMVYDVELSYGKVYKNMSHRSQLALYSKNINDWIIWLPVNASVWHAQNARKVWARGLEVREQMAWKMHKFQFQISGYYSYVKSTYEQNNLNSSEDIVHKQLIYVPPHQASLSGTLSYKHINLRYTHHYTSWRFTSSDNEEFLDSYQLSSVYLNIQLLHINKNVLLADCVVDNIFNSRIESVANVPMALRTFKFGIIYQLNQ